MQLFDIPVAPLISNCTIHTNTVYSGALILEVMEEEFECGLI